MSAREIRVNRVSHIVFWSFGMVAGFVWQEHWRSRPVEAACAAVVLYFVALFVFDHVSRRVVSKKLLHF
jgi:hypothetical protein